MLFECNLYQEKRQCLWENVTTVAPSAFVESVTYMSAEEKTHFFVSGFKSRYIKEFSCLYSEMLKYLSELIQICKTTISRINVSLYVLTMFNLMPVLKCFHHIATVFVINDKMFGIS